MFDTSKKNTFVVSFHVCQRKKNTCVVSFCMRKKNTCVVSFHVWHEEEKHVLSVFMFDARKKNTCVVSFYVWHEEQKHMCCQFSCLTWGRKTCVLSVLHEEGKTHVLSVFIFDTRKKNTCVVSFHVLHEEEKHMCCQFSCLTWGRKTHVLSVFMFYMRKKNTCVVSFPWGRKTHVSFHVLHEEEEHMCRQFSCLTWRKTHVWSVFKFDMRKKNTCVVSFYVWHEEGKHMCGQFSCFSEWVIVV